MWFKRDIPEVIAKLETTVLVAFWIWIEDAENKFRRLVFTEGNIILKLFEERGICPEDVT